MSDRETLLKSIATTIADYRAAELGPRSHRHVDAWVRQFPDEVQVPVLVEMDHVLKQTYFSRARVLDFLGAVLATGGLVGTEPREFLMRSNFLDIQKNGNSQHHMLEMFAEVIDDKYGIDVETCGSQSGAYIYLDDAIFSGNRAGQDLCTWITKDAPSQAVLHVIVLALHTGGDYWLRKQLDRAINSSGKQIRFTIWRALEIENRKYYRNNAEVYWPTKLPDAPALNAYMATQQSSIELRSPGGKLGPFSSEAGRQLVERELLLAGAKIRARCANPSEVIRPLGFSHFGIGFGATVVTYRNCPNNCPLALWWGEPDRDPSDPLYWHPLFPRKTYYK